MAVAALDREAARAAISAAAGRRFTALLRDTDGDEVSLLVRGKRYHAPDVDDQDAV